MKKQEDSEGFFIFVGSVAFILGLALGTMATSIHYLSQEPKQSPCTEHHGPSICWEGDVMAQDAVDKMCKSFCVRSKGTK